ncbi:MAG: adenylate/guanylate cyclase domain-containing protein [Balneolaceae bacterium]|jgi:class 3 adenylate cyclase
MSENKPKHISWSWQLKSPPKILWPYVTDTNRLFKDLRLPSIYQANISQHVEPGFIQLAYNGINRYEAWVEEPFEWEYPYHFGVKRHYRSGPYQDLRIQFDLRPNEKGTLLTCAIHAKSRRFNILSLLTTFKLKTLFKQRLKNIVHTYDTLAFQAYKPYQLSKEHRLVRGGAKRLGQIRKKLGSRVNNTVVSKLIDYIHRADDLELQRIRPYELASNWGISREEVLTTFLYAANEGLLNFNWDLRCPDCRTIQQSEKTLAQVHEPIFCERCKHQFNVNFNTTLQLSFTPHPLIRKPDPHKFCIRGPHTRPHVLIQQYLNPGDKRFLKTDLPVGTYTLRSNHSDGIATVDVRPDGQNTVHIALYKRGLRGEEVSITPDPNLSFENHTDVPQIITLERNDWKDDEVNAANATSSQLFRDLFTNEVLPKGEKISVDNITLMFTDLFNSTGMYNEEGDDKAVVQVIDHFEILHDTVAEENGAIVKTIGDSVMAVFSRPQQALRAYLSAQRIFRTDERFRDNFQLKAGIHQGSCVAVNLNNRIDYFGSTVNIASRFVDFASENEVIISHKACQETEGELQQILDEFEHINIVENRNAKLKGFKSESFPVKSITIDDSPLRLAI